MPLNQKWKSSDLSGGSTLNNAHACSKNWNNLVGNCLRDSTKDYIYGNFVAPSNAIDKNAIGYQGSRDQYRKTVTEKRVHFGIMKTWVTGNGNMDAPGNSAMALSYFDTTYTETPWGFRQRRNTGIDWQRQSLDAECAYFNTSSNYTWTRTYDTYNPHIGLYPKTTTGASGGWMVIAYTPTSATTGAGYPPPYIGYTTSYATHDTINTASFTTNKDPNNSYLTSGVTGNNWSYWNHNDYLNNYGLTLDVSIKFNPATLAGVGILCNEQFGKLISAASLYLNLSAYKYKWISPTGNSLTVEIHAGTMPTNAETPVEGPLLATFSNLRTASFTAPVDTTNTFLLTDYVSATIVENGEATYAKIMGTTTEADGIKPTIWVPISDISTNNVVILSKRTNLIAGDKVYLENLGFSFGLCE